MIDEKKFLAETSRRCPTVLPLIVREPTISESFDCGVPPPEQQQDVDANKTLNIFPKIAALVH